MTFIHNTIVKTIAGACVTALFFIAFAPLASAQTYYYPTYQVNTEAQIQMLLKQVQVLMAQLQALHNGTNYYNQGNHFGQKKQATYYGNYYAGDYDIEVTTDDADIKSDDTVTLSGDVELDGAPYATVWFEYGTDGDLDEDSSTERVTRDQSFEIEVDDVDTDDSYYFRAVAVAPNGERAYGTIRSFGDNNHNNNNGDIPDVSTEDADNITDNSARISGEVDMNDFEDGLAFFVYGDDEDSVMDVEDEDTYSDIDEDGDALQKIQVATNVDDSRSFTTSFSGLDDDTEYFYRFCVEYEDDDNDDVLACGDVESFGTDN
jgi:hypothetical protein